MKNTLFLLALLSPMVTLSANALSFSTETSNEFLPVNEAFQTTLNGGEGWRIELNSADDYYLYADKLKIFFADPFGDISVEYSAPQGEDYPDPLFGTVEVWHDDVQVQISPQTTGELWVEFQGCAEAGFCYPPERRLLGVISN